MNNQYYMPNSQLYFVGTEGGLNNILKKGILPPEEVFRLIDNGDLNDDSLGHSANGRTCSHTPEYVSLESHADGFNLFTPFNLYLRGRIPVIFKMKDEIRQDSDFINEEGSKEFKLTWETDLALYKGTIPLSLVEYYATLKDEVRDNPEEWNNIDVYNLHKI